MNVVYSSKSVYLLDSLNTCWIVVHLNVNTPSQQRNVLMTCVVQCLHLAWAPEGGINRS